MSPQEPAAMSSTIARELLAVVMAILLLVFLLLLLFYVHARRYRASNHAVLSSRIQFMLAVGPGTVPWSGLDPAVIRALPVTVFRPEDFKQGLECAVCLSELSEGEEARFLPKCSHGFHLECIDMWLHSHSTCPLCRILVCPEPMQSARSGTESVGVPPVGEVSGHGHPIESQNFTADVCGGCPAAAAGASSHQGSSSSAGSSSRKSERMLVIDIPSRVVDGFQSPSSPLPSSKLPAEDIRSPMSARLRSLRRLLSRRSRGFGSFCSPIEGDIEQGLVGVGGAVEAGKPSGSENTSKCMIHSSVEHLVMETIGNETGMP